MPDDLLRESEEQVQEEVVSEQPAQSETPPAAPETPPVQELQQQKPVPMVPIHALHEARMEIRALREQQRLANERLQYVDELKKQIEDYRGKAKIPNFEEDPQGNINARFAEQERIIAEQKKALDARNQYDNQMAQIAQVQTAVAADELSFAQEHPDYNEAAMFLLQARQKEYVAMGITDINEVNKLIQNDSWGIVNVASRLGKRPAEVMYNLAKERGFQPKQQIQQQDNLIDQVRKGQQTSKTLSKAGVAPKPNLEQLADLEGDEFDKEWEAIFGNKSV